MLCRVSMLGRRYLRGSGRVRPDPSRARVLVVVGGGISFTLLSLLLSIAMQQGFKGKRKDGVVNLAVRGSKPSGTPDYPVPEAVWRTCEYGRTSPQAGFS